MVNARVALFARDENAARALLAQHFARFLETCRLSVKIDGSPPAPGTGCILIYNETSFADVAAFGATLWSHVDRAAAAELYGYFPYGATALAKAGIAVVPRGNRGGTEKVMGSMVEAARQGARVAWGGEGRLQGQDAVGRFKVGGSLIAIRAQVPVVPMVLYGGHNAMPLGTVRARPGRIHIRFGAPIPTAGLTEEAARSLADQAQSATADIYADLKAAAQRP